MDINPLTATERFKGWFSNLAEQVCVLQEQLETAQARIKELEQPDRAEEQT